MSKVAGHNTIPGFYGKKTCVNKLDDVITDILTFIITRECPYLFMTAVTVLVPQISAILV